MIHRLAKTWIPLLAVLLAARLLPAQPAGDRPFLGLWITRWDYRTPADVAECIERAEFLGATDVFWQVRGQADAFYRSELEPWGRELFRDLAADATDPGFDPLEAAVIEAGRRGVRVHAWVNVMPLWKGKQPPADPKHPFNAHPGWRLRDSTGAPQPLNDHYVIVNPLLPEVQDHVVAVCRDIVTRYRVDGLHLDYVRFVSDSMADPAAYPRDAESIRIFRTATGRSGADDSLSAEEAAAYRDFKRERITALVRRIRSEAVETRPGVVLTAAVWRRPELARETYLQDAAAWVNQGVLDRACPMIYTKDDKQFESDLSAWLAAVPEGRRRISPGMGIYMHPPGGSGGQFALAQSLGAPEIALFAYAALYESADPNQDKSASKVAERAARLAGVRRLIAAAADRAPGADRAAP